MTNDSESAIIIDVKERKKYQFEKTKSCFVGAKLVIKIFRKFQKKVLTSYSGYVIITTEKKRETNKNIFKKKIKNLEKSVDKEFSI